MAHFLISRLFQTLSVVLLMSFVCYVLLGLMPGDPIDLLISADPRLSSEDAARIKAIYGLDQPLLQRYLNWLYSALQGDFGFSRLYGKPVMIVLWNAMQNTLVLMGLALLVSLSIAIPVGILAARRIHSATDYAINMICFAGISVPPFWLALMLILLFSVILGWLPANAIPLGEVGFIEQAKGLVLPVLTLAMVSIGGVTRYVRASLNESMQQDYIRTAFAKGLTENQVIRKHALRNSMIPVITIISLDVGAFFSGALITEFMFGYPGMGKLLFDAVLGSDYNLALVGLLMATCVTLIANFLADIAYAAFDPRISYHSENT